MCKIPDYPEVRVRILPFRDLEEGQTKAHNTIQCDKWITEIAVCYRNPGTCIEELRADPLGLREMM